MGVLLSELPANGLILPLGLLTLLLAYAIYGFLQRRHELEVRCESGL